MIVRKIIQSMNVLFRYAIQTGRAAYNSEADMQGVLKTKAVEHMPAVFDKVKRQLTVET